GVTRVFHDRRAEHDHQVPQREDVERQPACASVEFHRFLNLLRRAAIPKLIACLDEFRFAGPSCLAMEKLSCDVRALRADVAAVDALARLQLAARQAGFELRLLHASAELRGLTRVTRPGEGRRAVT